MRLEGRGREGTRLRGWAAACTDVPTFPCFVCCFLSACKLLETFKVTGGIGCQQFAKPSYRLVWQPFQAAASSQKHQLAKTQKLCVQEHRTCMSIFAHHDVEDNALI